MNNTLHRLFEKIFMGEEKDNFYQESVDNQYQENTQLGKNILDFLQKVEKETKSLPSELDEYIVAVKNLAKLKSDFVFKNSSHTHAAIVLTEMLNLSQKEFCLYDNDLSGDIAEEYPKGFFPALVNFVKRGGELKIVVDGTDGDERQETRVFEILRLLKESFPKRIQVRRASQEFAKNIESSFSLLLNFAVGDDYSFRYEDTNANFKERKAFCSFNNQVTAKRLKNVFHKNLESCPKIF